jgi:hypothetical protein
MYSLFYLFLYCSIVILTYLNILTIHQLLAFMFSKHTVSQLSASVYYLLFPFKYRAHEVGPYEVYNTLLAS